MAETNRGLLRAVDNPMQSEAAKKASLKKVPCEFCGQEVRPVNLERHRDAHFTLRMVRGRPNVEEVLPFYRKLLEAKFMALDQQKAEYRRLQEFVKWMESSPFPTKDG